MNYLTLKYKETEQRSHLLSLLGNLFDSKEIKKAFGRPVGNDDTYTWIVAMDGDNVAGFAAIRIAKNGNAELRHTYVLPAYRNRGIARHMTDLRMDIAKAEGVKLVRTTIDPARLAKYPGFAEDIRKGKWMIIKKVL